MDNENKPTSKNHSTGRRIIIGVVSLLVLLIVAIGIAFYQYFQAALKPLNPKSDTVVQVDIPMGASNKKIGSILQDKKIVKSGMVFNYYVKSNNFANFRAGYYQLKASMTLKEIAKTLQKGGSDEPIQSTQGKVLIQEGATVETVAKTVGDQTDFSKDEFLGLMKNEAFIKQLAAKYPKLLRSAMASKDVRYRLEGYLYPATYTASKNTTLKQLIEQMVSQTNVRLTPYYKTIAKKGYTVQHVLTLASLVEREGVNEKDRRKIAGVFLNRIAISMPLQSDISVLYAINKPSKTLTAKDLQDKSPYNLYKNPGYGPGPFNNPSLDSIEAVLNPTERKKDYLYFVANTKTGKIYYSRTFDEHNTKANNLESANDNGKDK